MAERELMCLVTCATVVTGNGGTQWQWPAAHRHFTGPDQLSACVPGSIPSFRSLLEFGQPVKNRSFKIGAQLA
ncbi:hypothetical protein J6590_020664 [Homalodisca vitripennis]|nr:hypothetical protein J6590_020664 [Homalodisca vitripennis]